MTDSCAGAASRAGEYASRGGQPGCCAVAVVGLEQLLRVADVEPRLAEAEAVHGLALAEPRDVPPGRVGRVALVEVALEQRDVLAREEVRRRRDDVALRMLGLLLHADDPVVLVELDDAVERRERRVGELVDGERAPVALRAPELDVVGERELEQVVGRDHEQVVAGEAARRASANRMSPSAPRRSSFELVPSSWTTTPCPPPTARSAGA